MKDQEKLKADEQKRILNRLVKDMAQDNDLYYATTMEIAERIVDKIPQLKASRFEDYRLVCDLSAHDIQAIISFH